MICLVTVHNQRKDAYYVVVDISGGGEIQKLFCLGKQMNSLGQSFAWLIQTQYKLLIFFLNSFTLCDGFVNLTWI